MGIDQPNITYRLWNQHEGKLVWERTYGEKSPTPLEILVSDHGQILSLSHSLKRAAVLLFDIQGLERLRVGLLPTGQGTDPHVRYWVQDSNVKSSMGGFVWSYSAMFTFFHHGERLRFSLRTAWGRRLLFDLEDYDYLELPGDDELESARNAENSKAIALLQSTLKDENDDWHLATLNSLILNRCENALPLLFDFEQRGSGFGELSLPTVGIGTKALQSRERILCAIGLRWMGAFPTGLPCHKFRSQQEGERLVIPVRDGRERDLRIQEYQRAARDPLGGTGNPRLTRSHRIDRPRFF